MPHESNQPSVTLDAERVGQLRTFLTVEAAAQVGSASARSTPFSVRRLVGGTAVAVVLGAGLFAASSLSGGPTSGPTLVEAAHAVTIERAADGWTTLTLVDIDADPDAVVAELLAAGIEARKEPIALARDFQGKPLLESSDLRLPGKIGGGFSIIGIGEVGVHGLAGLTVSLPPTGSTAAQEAQERAEEAPETYRLDFDRRRNGDFQVALRNDVDLTVIVLTGA